MGATTTRPSADAGTSLHACPVVFAALLGFRLCVPTAANAEWEREPLTGTTDVAKPVATAVNDDGLVVGLGSHGEPPWSYLEPLEFGAGCGTFAGRAHDVAQDGTIIGMTCSGSEIRSVLWEDGDVTSTIPQMPLDGNSGYHMTTMKTAKADLSKDTKKRLKLRFKGKKTKKLVKKTLKRKKGKVIIKLKGTATDAAGNKGKDTAKLTIK